MDGSIPQKNSIVRVSIDVVSGSLFLFLLMYSSNNITTTCILHLSNFGALNYWQAAWRKFQISHEVSFT